MTESAEPNFGVLMAARLRDLMDAAPVVAFVKDAGGRYL
jgi:hypothetical protein